MPVSDCSMAVPLTSPVALRAVRVAHVEEAPGVEHGQIDGRAGLQILHVQVAPEGSGRRRPLDAGFGHAGLAHHGIGRHGQDAHERLERHLDVVGEERDLHAVHFPRVDHVAAALRWDVQGRIALPKTGIRHQEHAAARARAVDAPVHPSLDGENLDLQHIPGLGPLDMDGSRDDVTALPVPTPSLARRPEIQHVLKDLLPRNAYTGEEGHRLFILGRPRGGQRVDANRLPGLHPQHWLFVDGKPAPAHVLWG